MSLRRDSIVITGGAAVAQWIRLRLPSWRPGLESQALINLNLNCDMLEKRK